jgi:hypothetical protein
LPLVGSRTDEPSRHRIHLDTEVFGRTQFLRDLVRNDGSDLYHRVVGFGLCPPGTGNDSVLVEIQIRCVEKEHLADAGFERIDVKCNQRRVAVALRYGELQFDCVGALISPRRSPSSSSDRRGLPGLVFKLVRGVAVRRAEQCGEKCALQPFGLRTFHTS